STFDEADTGSNRNRAGTCRLIDRSEMKRRSGSCEHVEQDVLNFSVFRLGYPRQRVGYAKVEVGYTVGGQEDKMPFSPPLLGTDFGCTRRTPLTSPEIVRQRVEGNPSFRTLG